MKRINLLFLAACAVLLTATGIFFSTSGASQSVPPPAAAAADVRLKITSDAGIAPVMPAMCEPLTTGGLLDELFVRNKPFSATFESETRENAPDGTVTVRRVVTRVWRDSQGRTRREQIIYPNGTTPGANDAASDVTISDPVGRWGYAPDVPRRAAHKHRLPETPLLGTLFDNSVPLLVKILRQDDAQTGAPQTQTIIPLALPLGIQTISGFAATGRRVTMRIPAGAIGNQQAVDATYETWVSPDLQILVKGSAGNPISGTHTFQLKTISRAEPAAALFAVPSGYTIIERGVKRTDLLPNAAPQPTATQTTAQ